MVSTDSLNHCGVELERLLLLKTSPIAVKFLKGEDEIPRGALRPKKDRGYHIAQCQAFAMSRREGRCVAMLKEDHWCWGPLVGYGLVKPLDEHPAAAAMVEDDMAARRLDRVYPRFECGRYVGVVSAPLRTANFEPDLVLVYSDTAQMRVLLLAIKYKEGRLVSSEFDPIDSCVFSTVPVIRSGEYRITLPDPGDYERAMAGDDEIILSVPAGKLIDLVLGVQHFHEREMGYGGRPRVMRPDFPQPEMYKKLFREWGLDVPT